uniref:Uncharacterized protein n=1 Tax=Setaria digitata TaxID=48799 RepID=A0A915Q0N0_9BILA
MLIKISYELETTHFGILILNGMGDGQPQLQYQDDADADLEENYETLSGRISSAFDDWRRQQRLFSLTPPNFRSRSEHRTSQSSIYRNRIL